MPLLKRINKEQDILRLQTVTQPTISQGTEHSLFTKLKTIVSNPFDALKVALAPEEGAYESLQALRETKQAAFAGVCGAKQLLNPN